jgi:hypothetical protein
MSELNKESLRPLSMADSEKTATHSVNPSFVETKETAESTMPSAAASTREQSVEPQTAAPVEGISDEKTPNLTAEGAENDDDFEYPSGWRLAVITIALCLSVFCMALVSISRRWPFGAKSANIALGQHNHRNCTYTKDTKFTSNDSLIMRRLGYRPVPFMTSEYALTSYPNL